MANLNTLLKLRHLPEITAIIKERRFNGRERLILHRQPHMSFTKSWVHFLPVEVLLEDNSFDPIWEDAKSQRELLGRGTFEVKSVDTFFSNRRETAVVGLLLHIFLIDHFFFLLELEVLLFPIDCQTLIHQLLEHLVVGEMFIKVRHVHAAHHVFDRFFFLRSQHVTLMVRHFSHHLLVVPQKGFTAIIVKPKVVLFNHRVAVALELRVITVIVTSLGHWRVEVFTESHSRDEILRER